MTRTTYDVKYIYWFTCNESFDRWVWRLDRLTLPPVGVGRHPGAGGRGGQPIHSGVAADGGARRGVWRGHDAHGVGGTLQEALDVGGQLSVLRLLGFALRRGAAQARGQFVELEGGDGAHLS